jgi:hypothetical protein
LATNELAVESRQRTVPHFFFHQGIFDQNNMTASPTLTTFLFLQLKMKLKGRHFYTVEAMEAESQAVLDTLTDHNLQDTFKNCQKRWERCIRAERDTASRVMVASRPKISF